MKKCTKCKLNKELDQFGKDKTKKDGLSNKCSECYQNYYKQNCSYILNKSKTYDKNNKDKKSNYIKQFYKENKEYFQKYNEKNKEKQKQYFQKYYKDNREYHINYKKENKNKRNEYERNRRKNDIQYKLSKNLRSTLYRLLTKIKANKSNSALTLIGCSMNEYKIYLENQLKPEMNWDNYGIIWEIDHIIPCFTFDLTDIEQQKQCFHYTNLRPLFKNNEIAKQFGYNEIGNQNRSKTI